MEAFLWSYLAVTFLLWFLAWAMFARFRTVPVPERGAPLPGVRVSVIIPARNEEDNLSRLLPSLSAQEFRPLEILVVDDHSTDGTAAVAAGFGATVLSGQALPEGWFGKPWACHQGAAAAKGDWFLFLDADLTLEPEGLQRIAALARNGNAVYSICPYHRIKNWYEELSAFFNSVMVLGMNAFTLKGEAASGIGLFGQAMFLSRESYEKSGGHSSVKREVLENFHLSRRFRELGIVCRCFLGKGTISMRMFPGGVADLIAGWSKGFVSGAGNTARTALIGISIWLSGLIMICISATFSPMAGPEVRIAIAGLYLAGFFQCLFVFKKTGNFSVLNALVFPVALVFYQVVFFRAVRRKKSGGQIQWKGRDVG
jgi:4,4'-diaponeurosporenoate glycosyltransferase